jgi:hypothetical protein
MYSLFKSSGFEPPFYNLTYCHEGDGSATYKYVDFGLDTGFIVHSLLTTLVISMPQYVVPSSHIYSLQSNSLLCTGNEPTWSAVPAVLGYRPPSAGIPVPGFLNTLRRTAAATLDSLCAHWNSLGALSNNYFTGALATRALELFLMTPLGALSSNYFTGALPTN